MQFICVVGRIDPDKPLSITPEQMEGDWNYIRGKYGEGKIRQAWSRVGLNGGVLLIEAESADEAIATASGLPLMREGMLRVEATYPLAPYRGFVGK